MSARAIRGGFLVLTAGLIALVAGTAPAQPAPARLKIGTTGSLAEGTSPAEQKGALDTLHKFIQTETGFENEIVDHQGWRDLAQRMEKGEDQIGVFPGFELAWAQEKFPKLKPLAVAVNGQPYRQVFLVIRRDSKVNAIEDLKGKKITMPKDAKSYALLVLDSLAKKPAKEFAGEVKLTDNAEDALDDLVDGVVDAAIVERTAIDGFKRRKPARFAQLKDLAKSKPLPPTTIVYYDGKLDEATLTKFRDGLVNANKKEKGRNLMTYFKLSGFVPPPREFDSVLAETRKDYPEKTK
jgi:ABC-type phosphate/phosphonate transport system substrate-binding protein